MSAHLPTIKAMIEDGHKCKAVARAIGRSPDNVYAIARANGLNFNRNRREQFINCLLGGFNTSHDIALVLGISRQNVLVRMVRFEQEGLVEKVGIRKSPGNRPYTVWRLKETA